MTAIIELKKWIEERLQEYHYPKHDYAKYELMLNTLDKLQELCKKDLKDIENNRKKYWEEVNYACVVLEDLEEVVETSGEKDD